MIKISVSNLKNGLNFSGIFPSQQLADVWIGEQVALKSWGEPAGWRSFTFGDILQGYTDTRVNGNVTEYFYPQEFTVSISDISLEVAREAAMKKAMEEAQKGINLKLSLQSLVKTKLALGQVTLEQASAFVESEEVKKVERYLGEGYLGLVRPIMESGSFPLLTAEEKASFIAQL